MFACNTVDDGHLWSSKIGGVIEGHIRIEREDVNGNFIGEYLLINIGITIPIEGRCLSDIMWFNLPATNPAFTYWGEKSTPGGQKTVTGKRFRLREFLDEKLAMEARLLPDEWIAEKGV
jgi:hypothetical protein